MEASRIQELTKDAFFNLKAMSGDTQSTQKQIVVVQLISIHEDGNKCQLSDGFAEAECLFFKSCKSKVTELNLRPFDVLSTTMIVHKKQIFVVVDVSVVYKDVGCLIGKPIKFEHYEQSRSNPNGDCAIPMKFWAPQQHARGPSAAFSTSSAHKLPAVMESDDCTPISMLTVGSNSWLIKARVVSKSDIKHFGGQNTQKKPGCLFNVILADKTGKVQATFFTDVAQKYHDFLKEGEVYTFSGGEVKRKSQFNSTNSSVEITFGTRADIQRIQDDGKIAKEHFEFLKLKDVADKEPNSICDVVGLVKEVAEPTDVTLRSGEMKKKRIVILVDDSMTEVEVNFWGDTFQVLDSLKKDDLVLMTGLKVNEYRGKQLANTNDTKISLKMPDHPRVKEVIIWRNQLDKLGPQAKQFQSLKVGGLDNRESVVMNITAIKRLSDELVHSDSFENKYVFMFCGVLSILPIGSNDGEKKGIVTSNFYYNKCPTDTCYRKVNVDGESVDCPVCGIIKKPPVPRFMGTCRFTDSTDNMYCKFGSDFVGVALYGKTLKELKEYESLEPNRETLLDISRDRQGRSFYVKVSPKKENFNGEFKTVFNIVTLIPINAKTAIVQSKNLLNTIKAIQVKKELEG